MKSLSDYTNQAQTDLFNETGAFFAFNKKQFEESQQEGVKYVSLGAGMICPKGSAKALLDGLSKINTQGIESDMRDNSVKDIIWREFANFECQIVSSPEAALDALEDYPIEKQVILEQWPAYWQHCIDNDYF